MSESNDLVAKLLAQARLEASIPPHQERVRLRKAAGFSLEQVGEAVGVTRAAVSTWEKEDGHEPRGEQRTRYARLLHGLAEIYPPPFTPCNEERAAAEESSELAVPPTAPALTPPAPVQQRCVLCGGPATDEVEGFPQHLDPADCVSSPTAHASPQPATPHETAASSTSNLPHTPPRTTRPPGPVTRGRSRRAELPSHRTAGPAAELLEHLTARVDEALTQHDGDTDAATTALVHKAIPDAMTLLDLSRTGGRYDFTMHPPLPDLLRKKSAHGSDAIWEARPKWAITAQALPFGEHQVTALDMNAAYLAAFKAHLPIGALEHHLGPDEGGPAHDKRRSGIHLITPPAWDHPDLPNPLGAREEPGRLWVTEPTLRLLQGLAGGKQQLCEPPLIHESWTSGSSEGLLEKLRITLTQARATALENGDTVSEEYIKAMYSKFISTMGESSYNREINRPDWMHTIRAQAFTNLWRKALKARTSGLHVIRVLGTDELHVAGDWQQVFPEGRGVTEVKVKDTYTVTGTGTGDA